MYVSRSTLLERVSEAASGGATVIEGRSFGAPWFKSRDKIGRPCCRERADVSAANS